MANLTQDTVEDFTFWLPFAKAETVKDPVTGKQVRKIKGVASTPDVDLQGEVIHQKGLDPSYFLSHGYFNNDHKPGFKNKVGEPTDARVKNNQFWVEGFLYENHPVADEIWTLMQAQAKTPQAKRKVGFSVQGKVKRRMGNQILNCWIQDVAITPAPINTKTFAEIAKSLASEEWADEDVDRALTTGYAITNQTGGAALRPESLDHDEKDLSWGDKERKRLGKSFTREEAITYLQLRKGFSRSTAIVLVEAHCAGVI